MDIFDYEAYTKANDGDELSGVVYMTEYHEKQGASRKYMEGTIYIREKIPFKMWQGPAFTMITKKDFTDKPIFVKGTVSKQYNNFNITDVAEVDETTFPKENFKKISPYKIEILDDIFKGILKKNLTHKGFELINSLMEMDKEDGIYSKFKTNYAASSHHDNCEGGLLAHTYKCLNILENFYNIYPWMDNFGETMTSEDFKDLMFIGIAIHDVGKINEINEEVYFPESFNTHRIMGLEVLFEHKKEIIDAYSEHFYNVLVSILVGHHHEYGDKAKTLAAYLVHQIDCIDSIYTEAGQVLTKDVKEDTSGKNVYFNGSRFFL